MSVFLAPVLSLTLAAVLIFAVTQVCPSPISPHVKNDQNEATNVLLRPVGVGIKKLWCGNALLFKT